MMPPVGYIVKCPKCLHLHAFMSCVSGNTFGGVQLWSDGLVVSAMMPEVESPIIRCAYGTGDGNCDEIFWKDDAEVHARVEKIGWRVEYLSEAERKAQALWEELQGGQDIFSEDDYYEAMERRVCGEDVDKWKCLRTAAWYAMNNPLRQLKDVTIPFGTATVLSARARSNLESLAALTDEKDPQERLQKGELLRELGQFDGVLKLLGAEFGWEEGAASTAAAIRDLALKGDTLVRVVHDDRL